MKGKCSKSGEDCKFSHDQKKIKAYKKEHEREYSEEEKRVAAAEEARRTRKESKLLELTKYTDKRDLESYRENYKNYTQNKQRETAEKGTASK